MDGTLGRRTLEINGGLCYLLEKVYSACIFGFELFKDNVTSVWMYVRFKEDGNRRGNTRAGEVS